MSDFATKSRGERKMISGAQIRAAMGLLGLSQGQLAMLAGVSTATVYRSVAGDDTPPLRVDNLSRIEAALRSKGVAFFADEYRPGTEGIRWKTPAGLVFSPPSGDGKC